MVKLIYRNNKPVGWEICPTTDEEQKIAAYIRDLQFFGFNDTAIEYNGLQLLDENKGKTLGNIKSLSWIQSKYSNEYYFHLKLNSHGDNIIQTRCIKEKD